MPPQKNAPKLAVKWRVRRAIKHFTGRITKRVAGQVSAFASSFLIALINPADRPSLRKILSPPAPRPAPSLVNAQQLAAEQWEYDRKSFAAMRKNIIDWKCKQRYKDYCRECGFRRAPGSPRVYDPDRHAPDCRRKFEPRSKRYPNAASRKWGEEAGIVPSADADYDRAMSTSDAPDFPASPTD